MSQNPTIPSETNHMDPLCRAVLSAMGSREKEHEQYPRAARSRDFEVGTSADARISILTGRYHGNRVDG